MNVKKLDMELDFTKTYSENINEDKSIREARCLKIMFKDAFCSIEEGDLFAGRLKYPKVGFGLEEASGGPAYYCATQEIQKITSACECDDEYRSRIKQMNSFWDVNATIRGKLWKGMPVDLRKNTSNGIGDDFGRLSGACIDFQKLVRLGIPGLLEEVRGYEHNAVINGLDVKFYEGARMALELLINLCLEYSRQAKDLVETTDNIERKKELIKLSQVLEKITDARPETLREAMQLMWLYALISGVVNYGRMDVYLGNYFVNDVAKGIITEDEALKLLQSLWKLIADRKINFNSRIIIGGRGRRNEENADRFSILAMEATRTVIETEPQLTLRFYKGMNPVLMEKALDVIGEGRTFPMLYNDDVNVPAVQHAFNIVKEDAEQYIPYGCGEYAIEGLGFGSPSSSLNLLKTLHITMYNGLDKSTGKQIGLKTGEFSDFKTFEEFFNAYKLQLKFFTSELAKRHVFEYDVLEKEASFLYISMLFDNCLEEGKSIVSACKYKGGIIESFGLVNASDSLTAIKELVFDKKSLTHEVLLKVLESNFINYEKQHNIILNSPNMAMMMKQQMV